MQRLRFKATTTHWTKQYYHFSSAPYLVHVFPRRVPLERLWRGAGNGKALGNCLDGIRMGEVFLEDGAQQEILSRARGVLWEAVKPRLPHVICHHLQMAANIISGGGP
jgi:hypothetical protein